MKKIRVLNNAPGTNWCARSGPAIGEINDFYFLQHESWLEFKMSSLAECKADGVIPWIRSGARGAILEAEKLEMEVIIGPNCVFACSDKPELNDVELKSPAIHRLLMSDEDNGDKARSLCSYDTEKIQQVPYFMRPELYNDPFKYEKVWDCYFHVKTGINKFAISFFDTITATHHGWYDFPELKYKAQHSEICMHGCHYDNYGLAVHEISLLGCPLVYDKFGMKRGSVGEGMGIEVSVIDGANNLEELKEAVEKAKAMDRKKVWEASHEYQSIENCKRRYKKALGVE